MESTTFSGDFGELATTIVDYFHQRSLVIPTFEQAMGWIATEIGEAWEVWLTGQADWVRNHPDEKPVWDPDALEEELGDVIFMAMIAGMVLGKDPLRAMLSKMRRKTHDHSEET